jgi:hypothetical protein
VKSLSDEEVEELKTEIIEEVVTKVVGEVLDKNFYFFKSVFIKFWLLWHAGWVTTC